MNKLLIISGGTKGIGRAIVEKFLNHNYDIATCARNKQDLKQLKTEMEAKFPRAKTHIFRADLSDKEEVLQFAGFVKGLNQPIDVLINNTGFFIPGKIHEEEEGALESMMNTNLYSAYHLTRALLPDMISRKEGDIFNMCSVASIMAYPNGGSYSISKFALLGFTKVLREELKQEGIRVIGILPGATLTASWEGVEIPPERFMKSSDIADSVLSAHQLSRQTVVEEIIIRPQLGDL